MAQRRTDVYERVGPLPGPIGWDRVIRQSLEGGGRKRPGIAGNDPAEHPAHVGVHRPDGPAEGDCSDRPGRIWPHAGQGLQVSETGGDPAVEPFDDLTRGLPQAQRAPVVAEPLPGAQDVRGRRRGEDLDRREARHEPHPGLPGASGLRLLGHRLRDEDRVGVGGRAERERPGAAGVPGENGVAERGRERAGSGHGTTISAGDQKEDGMRFGAAFWTNRTSWVELRDACLRAERAGWDSLWIDDHLLADEGDPGDSKLEGWTTLAALAVLTERVRLGLLVGANTFRNPGLTAKLATTLDHLSDGRAVLGLGGGWFEREHDAFGLDFGSGFGERLDRLDEAVGLIRRLLDGETVTHDGRFYTMRDAVCEPRPVQARLPVLIGGSGPTKTLRTTARFADLWNAYGSPERVASTSEILAQRCAEVGRPFDDIERTVTINAVIRDTAAAAGDGWAKIARIHGLEDRAGSDDGESGLLAGGPPVEMAAYLDGFRRNGVGEVIFTFRAPFDLETIDRVGELSSALDGLPD